MSSKKLVGDLLRRAGTIPFAISGALAVATALICHGVIAGRGSSVSWALSLLYGIVLWIWWALVAEALWRLGRRHPSTLRITPLSFSGHLAVAAALAVVHLELLQLTALLITHIGPPSEASMYAGLELFNPFRFGIEFLMYGSIWFACAAIATQLAVQHNAMRSLELERQLSAAHLRTLQMQLEPHFLFNTLNAITTLIELGRGPEALATLEHLNIILKTVLKRNTPSKIPLAQELEMVESYLAIERVRFADRLRVNMDLDPAALDGLVPSFLLQPIIENAIRHGIAHCESEGWIAASARRIGSRMELHIRDNGPGVTGNSRSGFGVGLSNTRDRLSHFYHGDYEFRTSQPVSGGFEVSITIPYENMA